MDKRIQQTLGTKQGDFEVINYSQDKHQYLCRCLFCGEEKFLPKIVLSIKVVLPASVLKVE